MKKPNEMTDVEFVMYNAKLYGELENFIEFYEIAENSVITEEIFSAIKSHLCEVIDCFGHTSYEVWKCKYDVQETLKEVFLAIM